MPDSLVSARRLPAVPVGGLASLRRATRAVGFWLAVVLPLAYLPAVLLAPATVADPVALIAAVTVNLAAIVAGHGHDPGLRPERRG